jgi:hypothetical protein
MHVEGSCSTRETNRVRRRWSIEEWSSSEGANRKGADDGDARAGPARRRGSGGGKPVRRMPRQWGMSVRRSGMDG